MKTGIALSVKKKILNFHMYTTLGRIRIRIWILISIKIESWTRTRIRIGSKTMPIHNTERGKKQEKAEGKMSLARKVPKAAGRKRTIQV
jgi:hypothetical protein